jgi:hypothetical protein
MKLWWLAFLVGCASEPKPAPVAPPAVAQPPPAARPTAPAKHDGGQDVITIVSDDEEDDQAQRRPGADLKQQIDEVREDDTRVGTGRGPNLGSKPMAGDPGKPGRISILEKQAFDDTTLTADVVIAKVSAAYMAGVKRCYREYLKKDPSAKGELVLKLTVNKVGRAIDGKALGVANEIDDCVAAQIAQWRFPVPKDKSGDATTAAFQIKLGLVPD